MTDKKIKILVIFVLAVVAIFPIFFLRIYHIDGKYSIEIGNPQDSWVVIKNNEIIQRNLLKKAGFSQKYEKIGWISDIHADRFKRRTVDSGTLYPRQYEDYLPKVFDDLRGQGIDTVIATGDNTNSGDDNYAISLEKIAQEKRMNVIWVTGNHDNDRVMSILGETGNKYYYVDYGSTRIVVLDDAKITRETGDYAGGIEQEQLAWLKDILKTDKQVIVSMHIPIFPLSLESVVVDQYAELEKILQGSGNVKMVLSGHYHLPWQKEYDGIDYYGQAALTREEYKGAYAVIDLKNNFVDYLFAK